MGTTSGRTQIDPGICFHPGCVISHTQYACTTNMAHSRTKSTATPEGIRLAKRERDVEDGIFVHRRIFLCGCQGVIRITVNTIETLAPLLDGEFYI